MELRYIRNISANECNMYLYDEIGYNEYGYGGISGTYFVQEVDYILRSRKEITLFNVHINSPGGSVWDGWSIFSKILDINKNEKGVYVDVYIDGLAASTASWISAAARKVYMMEHALFMLHFPSYPDSEDDNNPFGTSLTQKDKEVLGKYSDSINIIYQRKTGLSEAEINSMMAQETWMNAKEAKDLKFVDEILLSGLKKPEPPQNAQKAWAIYNSLIKKPKNTMETGKQMSAKSAGISNELASILGVKNTAEAVVVVNQMKAKNVALEQEKATLTEKIKADADKILTLENALKLQKHNEAVNFVQTLVNNKVIAETEKDAWIEGYEENPERCQKMANSLKPATTTNSVQPPKLSDLINKAQNSTNNGADNNWSYMEWMKNDSKGLEEMKILFPADYENLVSQYLETKKKK